MPPKTLYQKIWDNHVVWEDPGQPALIYIDRHLIHEGTSPQAFAGLRAEGRTVRRPDLTFAVMDHSVPTTDRTLPILDNDAKLQFEALEKNCREFGVRLFDMNSRNQGIVHIIGPELASPSRDRPLSAETATLRRMVLLARWRLGSVPAKSSMCWQRNA